MEKALEILELLKVFDGVYTILNNKGLEINKAIAELEEAMKPKSCAKCAVTRTDLGYCNMLDIYTQDDFFCSSFKPKESK